MSFATVGSSGMLVCQFLHGSIPSLFLDLFGGKGLTCILCLPRMP